jgi:hypothetical protein
MKKQFLLIKLVTCFFTTANAQTKFDFELGSRLRVTPIYLRAGGGLGSDERYIAMQQDPHISGLSLVTGIRYKAGKKILLGARCFIRYDELFAEIRRDSILSINNYIKRIMIDYQLYGLYQVIEKEKYTLNAGLGLTFCNNNTVYSYNIYRTIQPNNQIIQISLASDFRFTTVDLPIELQKNRFRFGLTTSITMKHKFFAIPSDFLAFNLSMIYAIPLRAKSKK